MESKKIINTIVTKYLANTDHAKNDYFSAIKELIQRKNQEKDTINQKKWQEAIDSAYDRLKDEIIHNTSLPISPVKFGTSGWRGFLGKDLFVHSTAFVTAAILSLYKESENSLELQQALGVSDFGEMQTRGCVLGFDNRFGGEILALSVANVLSNNGIKIFYAGESTTGTLSASVLERNAAFSINLTPSHNPFQYGGFKFNASDAGPAAPILTNRITEQAALLLQKGVSEYVSADTDLLRPLSSLSSLVREDALYCWQNLVRKNKDRHGLDYDDIIARFQKNNEICIAVDCIHGASRTDINNLFNNPQTDRLIVLRGDKDFTFGGISPEPSSKNMQPVMRVLKNRPEKLKIGVIIDPDGDRIRFTDGNLEIGMNQFGAMSYHFIHEIKRKKGMVAKTVATSNFANVIAKKFGEDIFEPKVGFKEFKPVIGKALVYFEESDGISIIGHTPEKDAYIGLLLAMDMVLTLNKNLGDYLKEIENEFGCFYPDRDGVTVAKHGQELLTALTCLEKYDKGCHVVIGTKKKMITEVITIDGRKMIFDDGSWLMIRPSGTEPKVRFYVEGRNSEESILLRETAKSMLAEIGLLS